MSFDDLGLGPEVLRGIADAGYVEPTPIQKQAIPYVLMGRDVLGCAQTGTGKTASFTLPMIEMLAAGRAKARMPRSLILTPTRELAQQISENFEIYGKYHKLNMALLIGGTAMDEQIKKLDRGVDVLIATPGRLLDHFGRGRILLNDIKVLVIDEADRMLDMGFIPDVENIVGLLPKIRQTLFFSATMPPEIRRLADAFLMNPKEISVAPTSRPAAETVEQGMIIVDPADKRDALRQLLAVEKPKNALIFCNRKRDVRILFQSLSKHGFNVGELHGDLTQSTRTQTLEAFKKDEIAILVASDVAARGLDIDSLSHVFNFDVPTHPEDYIHRIGRTGRAGKLGRAFTLATPEEGKYISAINRLLGKDIPMLDIEGITNGVLEDGKSRRGPRRRKSGDADERPARRSRSGGASRGAAKSAPSETEAPAPVEAAEAAPAEAKEIAPRETAKSQPREAAKAEPREQPRREPRPDAVVTRIDSTDSWRERRPRDEEDSRQPRNRRKRMDNSRDDRDDKPVVGMGEHTPAFMLRPARVSGE